MSTAIRNRTNRLLPGGTPRYIRCYKSRDNCADPYTVVFTGNYRHLTGGSCLYLGMSGSPYHPQGVGQHGESANIIDKPRHGHLGKRITFRELPEDCQSLVLRDYEDLWGLGDESAFR